MKKIRVKDLELGQVILLNGRNGKTRLCPSGNEIIKIKKNETHSLLSISGWDGDFNIMLNNNDIAWVEK